MPEMDGLTLLKKLKESEIDTAMLMMTAHGDIHDAVEAIKLGAYDYLLKPFELEELNFTIEKLVQMQNLTMENLILKDRLATITRFENLVGQSPPMLELFDTIVDVAQSDATILITGETGSGKELVARAIHMQSPRCYAPFIAINCGAFTEHLLESELFGHEKGAFTDAKFTKKGRLEMANAGTLFLDEIGDISTKMQIDLLRVLETHEFNRVGGSTPLKSDFRVIAATNQDLQEAIRRKTFRQDLFYRLNVIHLQVPPLRERLEDIPLLAQHFLRRYATETKKKVDSIHPKALEAMQQYSWPGNVRELENAIERAVVVGKGRQIKRSDLPFVAAGGVAEWGELSLEELERQHIAHLLATKGGNLSNVAKILRINRSTLYEKIKKYGLSN
jgi:two-component system response regulator HydG